MSEVGQIERKTQNRVVKLFREQLDYKYLGNWEEREDNRNIEESLFKKYLAEAGYNETLITKALYELRTTANNPNDDLYEKNKKVYSLLRYGVDVKAELGTNTETVTIINWKNPEKNHFYIAEEVTIHGNRDKRPDIVLYINGLAIAVLELKRSTVSIGDGIRQSIVNQRGDFIEDFFSTIQFVFAGNDTEGLRYGTIKTPEKFFLTWKEDVEDDSQLLLDKYLAKMCDKERLIDLIYNFILFDGGIKKVPRYHQYFGIKEAQKYVRKKEGGIIWHTQGSGKSIVMVLLAKWILENNHNARVVIITDRDELDKQIERVFKDADERDIKKAKSGKDLMNLLSTPKPRLMCSLVHKFGKREEGNFEEFIREMKKNPPHAVGEIYVFVDECHRTQSGKLHRTMKAMLPNAIFVGYTGTPLLKKDKQTSLEVFGKYIHTYKFNEAVEDGVVLDLVYEARDIDQRLTSDDKIDQWFDTKTRGLNDYQKAELKKKWGTMQKVLSSASRMDKVISDLLFDFSCKPRLSSQRGNAILVASSIYEACKYFEKFQNTELKGKCAVITSYNPQTKDITTEGTGEDTQTDKEFVYTTYTDLLAGKSTEDYEEEAKKQFHDEPSKMKLLIVVDKLLTGFDVPTCTYLYIDKSMKDHGLFQAICRVNRLDGEDKPFGYIVDYKDLFKRVEKAIAVYTSELDFDDFEKEDCEIMLKDRLEKGREKLDQALEVIALLCEPVENPKGTLEHIRYFCGNTEIEEDLKKNEVKRSALYKATAGVVRSYADIADSMAEAGYSDGDVVRIKSNIDHYIKLRNEIRLASGETIDLKSYEADMRHLIDRYIQADEPNKISNFEDDMSLIDVIVKTGIADAINQMPEKMRKNKDAAAETIENNVRKKIIKEQMTDPAFFEAMSKLLDAIIKERKKGAVEYEKYLDKIADLAKKVREGKADSTPETVRTPAQRALYNNLGNNAELALKVHEVVMRVKPDNFRGNTAKENVVKEALWEVFQNEDEVERIFQIIEKQSEF